VYKEGRTQNYKLRPRKK